MLSGGGCLISKAFTGPFKGDETHFRVKDLPEKITDIYSRVLTTLLFWIYAAYIHSQSKDFGPPPMETLL